ncbi:hypothetical protein FALCPG4_18857 [Fusarium falciforme]
MQRTPESPDENPPVEPMLGQTGGASSTKQNHAAGRAAFSGLLLDSSFFLFGAIGSESQVRACWDSGYCPMMDSIGTAVARTAPETWVPTFGRQGSEDVGHEEKMSHGTVYPNKPRTSSQSKGNAPCITTEEVLRLRGPTGQTSSETEHGKPKRSDTCIRRDLYEICIACVTVLKFLVSSR